MEMARALVRATGGIFFFLVPLLGQRGLSQQFRFHPPRTGNRR